MWICWVETGEEEEDDDAMPTWHRYASHGRMSRLRVRGGGCGASNTGYNARERQRRVRLGERGEESHV